MNKLKISLLIVGAIASILIVGCGNKDEAGATGTTATTSTTATTAGATTSGDTMKSGDTKETTGDTTG